MAAPITEPRAVQDTRAIEVPECNTVTCDVLEMTNVEDISVQNFSFGVPLTVACKDGHHHEGQESFNLTCLEDQSVAGAASCVQRGFTLSGSVINGYNDTPIENGTVSIAGLNATTLSNGSYTISGIPIGVSSLNATRDQYISQTREVNISEDATHDVSPSTADDQRVTLEWDGSVDLETLAMVGKGNWRSGGFPYHDYKCSVRPNWNENWDQWT